MAMGSAHSDTRTLVHQTAAWCMRRPVAHQHSSSSQRCSVWLRSGPWAGHSSSSLPTYANYFSMDHDFMDFWSGWDHDQDKQWLKINQWFTYFNLFLNYLNPGRMYFNCCWNKINSCIFIFNVSFVWLPHDRT